MVVIVAEKPLPDEILVTVMVVAVAAVPVGVFLGVVKRVGAVVAAVPMPMVIFLVGIMVTWVEVVGMAEAAMRRVVLLLMLVMM